MRKELTFCLIKKGDLSNNQWKLNAIKTLKNNRQSLKKKVLIKKLGLKLKIAYRVPDLPKTQFFQHSYHSVVLKI